VETLGADARLTGTLYTFEDVAELAQRNPKSVVMFSVRYTEANGETVPHALLATRGPGGIVLIVDRSRLFPVTSLAAFETTYPGIGSVSAVVQRDGILIRNAVVVERLNSSAPLLMNALALELRSIPIP